MKDEEYTVKGNVRSLVELARPQVLGLVPYSPGRPIEEVQRELGFDDVLKLASNENPLGPSPLALQSIREGLQGLHRYPDGGCYNLRETLGRSLGVKPEQLCFGNGSNELLELVTRAFVGPEDEVVMGHPAFIVYRSVCRAVGSQIREVPLKEFTHDLDAMLQAVTPRTKLVFLGNPNNPTGTCVPVTDLYNFVRELPGHVILVVDEAYWEYLPQHLQPHLLRYIREGRYLLALRTFSKAYGLAGLRMGYGVGPPEMAEILNRVRQPFNVNALAQRAAVAALDDTTHLEETLRITETGRQSVQSLLEGLGLSYVPSVTNFVLVNVRAEGAAIASALFRKGVIVRSMEGYDLPTFIRVTIGTPEENIRAIEALGTVLEEMEAAVNPSSPPGGRSGK